MNQLLKNLKGVGWIKILGWSGITCALSTHADEPDALKRGSGIRPNVILMMADDLGWGDTGYNGHPVLKTPNLDAMSREGIRFDRFYSASAVCSPTRGSCLTGRHPHRYGVLTANWGHMHPQEITLAEALKSQGYATGHFGKWHLGTLLPDYSGKGPARRPDLYYMTPGMSGFDEWFSTEYSVATWDPYDPANAHGGADVRNLFWHNGRNIKDGLEGCASRIVMDKAIPFIQESVQRQQPFFAVIWFHAPHAPVVAGPQYRAMYADRSEDEQHYYGCITAMDEQIGRLREELEKLGVADQTLLWFCSDNGPDGDGLRGRPRGSAGPFRGRKRSLFEGGVRVPGLLVWPEKIAKPRAVEVPCSTSDYYPTVLDALGFAMKGQPEPIDGVSLMPLIEGRMESRPIPIGFQFQKQVSLIDNRYKIISEDRGETWMLYDLIEDPGERFDLAAQKPEILNEMRELFDNWRQSCGRSLAGEDYVGAPD